MKYLILIFLFAGVIFAKDKTPIVINFDCIKTAGEIYHGSIDSTSMTYKKDGTLTYEFPGPIKMRGISDTTVFSRAQRLVIRHWDDKKGRFTTDIIMGNLKKPENRSYFIKKDDKLRPQIKAK